LLSRGRAVSVRPGRQWYTKEPCGRSAPARASDWSNSLTDDACEAWWQHTGDVLGICCAAVLRLEAFSYGQCSARSVGGYGSLLLALTPKTAIGSFIGQHRHCHRFSSPKGDMATRCGHAPSSLFLLRVHSGNVPRPFW